MNASGAEVSARHAWVNLVAPVAGLIVFFGGWELLVRIFDVRPFVLPGPWRILRHIAEDPRFYLRNARPTVVEALAGFAIALVAGFAIGAAMAHSRFIERAVLPVAVLVQVTPIIAYAPAFVIWLSFGAKPIVAISSLVAVVPIALNTVTGLRSVDLLALEVLESAAASRREIFWKLRAPSAMPMVFAAARISVGLALVGAVIGEFFAGVSDGLGHAIRVAQNNPLRLLDQMWGSIFVLGFIGAIATLAVTSLERWLVRWHASVRS